MTMRRVCVLYTGGTIAMTGTNGALKLPADPEAFLATGPDISRLALIDSVVLMNKDSINVTPDDWTLMATAIHERMCDGYSGFVILHGTDTMHFSASALAFAFGPRLNTPIVFTGAQAPASEPDGDGSPNMVNAVTVAVSDLAEVVISFNGVVFRGCRTQKWSERSLDAFDSPALYPLGTVSDRVRLQSAARTRTANDRRLCFLPHFDADILCISVMGGHLQALIRGADAWDGIVVQQFGHDRAPLQVSTLGSCVEQALAHDIPVVACGSYTDPACATPYTEEALRRGAIPAGDMTHAAAIAKFGWAIARARIEIAAGELSADDRLARIRAIMTRPYVGEMYDSVPEREL